MSRIFVSHASADAELADEFVDRVLRNGCNLKPEDVFYTSGTDTGIASGKDLIATVRTEVEEATLVVALITPTYQTRPVCIAELGAAWSRAGNLMPLKVPGLERSDLEGVLEGMTIRSLDESGALDELHQRVKEASQIDVDIRTWTRHKETWLRSVGGLAEALPVPRIVTTAEHEQALTDLERARETMGVLEVEISDLKRQVGVLRTAKDLSSVAEDLLPQGEKERFKELEARLEKSIRPLGGLVADVIWADGFGGGMPYPSGTDDYRVSDAEKEISDGYVRVDGDDRLRPEEDSRAVEAAIEARDRMQRFLTEETSERFGEWFRGVYDFGPSLERKAVWDQLT